MLFFLLAVVGNSKAQKFGETSTVVLKGKIENSITTKIEYNVTKNIDFEKGTIIPDKNGTFFKTLVIDNNNQELLIALGKTRCQFSVFANDTISFYWDDKHFEKTFTLQANNQERANTLKKQYQLITTFLPLYEKIGKSITADRNNINNIEIYNRINNLFNKQANEILNDSVLSPESVKFLYTNHYYDYSAQLNSFGLLPALELTLDNEKRRHFYRLDTKTLSDKLFWLSYYYRSYIYNRVHKRTFNTYELSEERTGFESEYYKAKGEINSIMLFHWFAAKNIATAFNSGKTFEEVDKVCQIYFAEEPNKFLKQYVINSRTKVLNLQAKKDAPVFTLLNEKDKPVKLSDFKGKIVYLDFWGVNCAPCIDEFKNHANDIHEKYKQDVVFINICVDTDTKTWKQFVRKNSLGGINLIAEGWTENKVCIDYFVQGLPRYVIIDRNGKIVDHNAPRYSELKTLSQNQSVNLLDRLIKEVE